MPALSSSLMFFFSFHDDGVVLLFFNYGGGDLNLLNFVLDFLQWTVVDLLLLIVWCCQLYHQAIRLDEVFDVVII